MLQGVELLGQNRAVAVDTRKIDLRHKSHAWRLVRIVLITHNVQAVDSVFVDRVGRAQNGAVPVRHGDVVLVGQAVGDGLGAQAFFALFQLLEQLEVPRAGVLADSRSRVADIRTF